MLYSQTLEKLIAHYCLQNPAQLVMFSLYLNIYNHSNFIFEASEAELLSKALQISG